MIGFRVSVVASPQYNAQTNSRARTALSTFVPLLAITFAVANQLAFGL
jgi:hypothetical protein